jgi:K+-sensing histidine kinase KdpD
MGLGLSIVKGIIDAHRGSIRESGEEGHGARFMIFLPVDVDKSEKSGNGARAVRAGKKRRPRKATEGA